MSRRKQSRPQHLDNDAKDMPGTDLLIAENKIRSAVTSSSPYIKVENKTEKVTTVGMTPSTAKEDTTLTHTAPSAISNVHDRNGENASPVAKFTNDDVISKSNMERETVAMTKTTKSASCGSFTVSTPMASNANSERCRRKSADAVVKQEFPSDAPTVLPNPCTENEANNELDKHSQYLPSVYTPMIALERKYECEKCGVSFRSKETYEVHRKHYCSGQRHNIECKLCGAKFDSDKVLSMHMEVHAPQYKCLICNESMASSEDCKKHMQTHVEESERPSSRNHHIQCPKCDITFDQKSELLGHLCLHHVTLGNMASFMYQQEFARAQQARILAELENSQRKDISTRHDVKLDSVPNMPAPDNLDDIDLHNISPPITTSTPARPNYTTRDSRQAMDNAAFTCIVCSHVFSDVVSLQHHLLTTHTSVGPTKSPSPMQSEVPTKHRPHNRLNCRKVSTVSPPQLSRLSGATSKKISEPVLARAITETTESPIERAEQSTKQSDDNNDNKHFVNEKKRKERSENEALIDQIDRLQNNLKKAKRDSHFVQSKLVQDYAIDKDSLDARRISCPIVSNKILEQSGIPGYVASNEEERHCIQCDIKFSSASNYRVHKKYYCASRHMKLNEDELTSLNSQEDSDIFTSKSRKRNAGNRSSMTYRKRSHLTPLETVRDSSPFTDSEAMNSMKTSMRKSCPSHIDAQDKSISKTPSPNGNASPVAAPPTITKKHLCQECNIWFSKYDTYVAHKKYYCESRRKDRVGVRSMHSSNKAAMKRKSESCLRDAVSRSESSLFGSDRMAWSPQRNSPSTDTEDASRKSKNIPSDHNLQSDSNTPTLPFSMYGGLDQEMLARLSFMQPLILSQYLTLMRERVLGIQNNGLLFPTLPLGNVTNGRSITPDERIRKLSADETGNGRYSGSPSKSPVCPNVARYPRPTRQSCVAAINVKEEAGASTGDSSTRASPENKISTQKRASPLDLSNKVLHGDEIKRSSEKNSPKPASYPTIDLRTTARAIVKQEPKSDFPKTLADDTSDKNSPSQRLPNKNNNSNNNQPEIIFSEVDDHASRSSSHDDNVAGLQQKSRAQHCKNCDAQFTNLSTFIAHKKYYCAGSNSTNNLIRSEAMAAQMAH